MILIEKFNALLKIAQSFRNKKERAESFIEAM